MKSIRIVIVSLAGLGMLCSQTPLGAANPEAPATAAAAPAYSPQHLDKLLAPVALYPDPLLAQILPASTSPSDIVMAARYVAAKKDPNKIDQQSWEESVKALARYPDVLKMMDEKLDWTTELGEAFVAQPKDVFASVQRLRAQADAVGNLKTTPQQVIVKEKEIIKIVPAEPNVVYVPVYQPDIVYVQTAPAAASVVTFTAGIALGIWIHNELNWNDCNVYYHNSGWHGGYYHGGNYHGGNNNINIDNSTNINVGNGNGNQVGNGNGNGNGNVWKPKNSTRPATYNNGAGSNNWSNNLSSKSNHGNNGLGSNAAGNNSNWSNKSGTANNSGLNRPNNGNSPSTLPAQQKPAQAQRPSTQPAARPANQSKPGFMSEGTKSRPSTTGTRSAPAARQAPAGGGGGRRDR